MLSYIKQYLKIISGQFRYVMFGGETAVNKTGDKVKYNIFTHLSVDAKGIDSHLNQAMKRFIKSFYFAANGLSLFFKKERNGRLQGIIALAAVVGALYFSFTRMEWMVLLFCTGAVIALEMINSAIEKICNMHSMEYNAAIKVIKDIAAGAVLWMSVVAAIIGGFLFIPHFLTQFTHQ